MSGSRAGLTEFRELRLIRLEAERLHPVARDGGEDVFKSSRVTFGR
jgi:hypothetical protein